MPLRATPEEMARRLERARELLGANMDAVSATVFSDEKRRTRYNTMLRTMSNGGTCQWKDLGRLMAYFAGEGFHLAWLLYGHGPMNTLQSGRPPDVPRGEAPTPSGIRLTKSRRR